MPEKKRRVIIDTNLWVSFLLSRNLTTLDGVLGSSKLTLLFSQELLDEFLEVIQRPKFSTLVSKTAISDLLNTLRSKAEFIEVKSEVSHCRDEKDNFLLSLAKDGSATHLITGDKDLLVIAKFEKTHIITLTEFLKG